MYFTRPLVSFPTLEPSKATPFSCYLLQNLAGGDDTDDGDFVTQPTFIAGETDSVEFTTSSDETRKVAVGGCRCVEYLCVILRSLTMSFWHQIPDRCSQQTHQGYNTSACTVTCPDKTRQSSQKPRAN
jgi:hypothetical protein